MSGTFDAWIGRTETATDTISARQARQMAATLGDTWAGGALDQGAILPNLWHWMGWSPATPAHFRFRGVGPLFHFNQMRLMAQDQANGTQLLCTATEDNVVCMQAEMTWKGSV